MQAVALPLQGTDQQLRPRQRVRMGLRCRAPLESLPPALRRKAPETFPRGGRPSQERRGAPSGTGAAPPEHETIRWQEGAQRSKGQQEEQKEEIITTVMISVTSLFGNAGPVGGPLTSHAPQAPE